MEVVITGASRGIGRALAGDLASRARLHLVARNGAALGAGGYAADLALRAEAARVGREIAAAAESPLTLVHNAGVWPSTRELVDGVERGFAVNCLGGLELQRPLLDAGKVARILVVSAGLLVKGRFDAERTPRGDDFSWFRTYASTKLAFAVAMREVARRHPDVDVSVVHPGVVRTDLGARPGVLGWLVDRVKSRWESPEVCAQRLAAHLGRERWSPPGEARWFFETESQPWPDIVERSAPAVLAALQRLDAPI